MQEGRREAQKKQAALAALALVESGMTLGLGSGSTFAHALTGIADRLISGELRDIRAVPSSEATAARARELGVPLVPLSGDLHIDLTIDGADEINPECILIKGGGGALLREKLIAEASERVAIAADESKLVQNLGNFPLPVEVLPFGWERQVNALSELGAEVTLRVLPSGLPYLTDNGHYILDCAFGIIDEPASLASVIKSHTGIIEHGLFIHLATDIFLAKATGVEIWHREDANGATLPHLEEYEERGG